MKVVINVKMVNSEFDQEFANQHYQGEESEDNIKYLWEDEFEVKGPVEAFKVINNTVYQLKGLLPDNSSFQYDIPEMTICECVLKDGSISQFAFSKKLIKGTEKEENKKQNTLQFFVYLRSSQQLVNPMDGVYILKEHFPLTLQAQ